MHQKRPRSGLRRGRKGIEKFLRELERDRQEQRRLLAALDLLRERTGYSTCDDLRQAVVDQGEDLARIAADFEQRLDTVSEDTVSEDSIVNPALVTQLSRMRRWRRAFLRNLPESGIGRTSVESRVTDLGTAAKVEAQEVPSDPHPESALLLLPTDWLRAMVAQADLRGHASRGRIAASCADRHARPTLMQEFVLHRLEPQHIPLFARITAAGRLPVDELEPEERADLAVGRDWRATATGADATLRRFGLVFVGTREGRRVVYVPEASRSTFALALLSVGTDRWPQRDSDVERRLVELARHAARRKTREDAARETGAASAFLLPTRRARLRRRTRSPDRVVDLEVVQKHSGGPRVLRHVRISHQRSLGALDEVIRLAMGLPRGGEWHVSPTVANGDDRVWTDPYPEGAPNVTGPCRNGWTASIYDALKSSEGRLRYIGQPGVYRRGSRYVYDVRLLRLHAPEHVAEEPRVVWGEGVLDSDAGVDAVLDAANLFLERLDP